MESTQQECAGVVDIIVVGAGTERMLAIHQPGKTGHTPVSSVEQAAFDLFEEVRDDFDLSGVSTDEVVDQILVDKDGEAVLASEVDR